MYGHEVIELADFHVVVLRILVHIKNILEGEMVYITYLGYSF